jgi:hypothetical protein
MLISVKHSCPPAKTDSSTSQAAPNGAHVVEAALEGVTGAVRDAIFA